MLSYLVWACRDICCLQKFLCTSKEEKGWERRVCGSRLIQRFFIPIGVGAQLLVARRSYLVWTLACPPICDDFCALSSETDFVCLVNWAPPHCFCNATTSDNNSLANIWRPPTLYLPLIAGRGKERVWLARHYSGGGKQVGKKYNAVQSNKWQLKNYLKFSRIKGLPNQSS